MSEYKLIDIIKEAEVVRDLYLEQHNIYNNIILLLEEIKDVNKKEATLQPLLIELTDLYNKNQSIVNYPMLKLSANRLNNIMVLINKVTGYNTYDSANKKVLKGD